MNSKVLRCCCLFVLLFLVALISCGKTDPQPPATVQEGYKTINGTEIYFKKMGSGEPIIMVHGGPVLDHGYLTHYFEPLTENYELIYFDQRLSGRSSAEVDSSDITLVRFRDDIEELRKAFGLDKFHLVAHSWGGLLAMKYALKYPSKLYSLVLLNSMPASSDLWREEQQILARNVTREDSAKRQAIINSELFKTDISKGVEQLLVLSFRNQFFDSTLADSLEFYIPEDYMVRSQRFGNLMPEISDYDLHPALSSMEVPSLLIYGQIEPAPTLSGPKLNQTLPNSKLVVIEQSGHFPFIEQPQRFLAELQGFLEEH